MKFSHWVVFDVVIPLAVAIVVWLIVGLVSKDALTALIVAMLALTITLLAQIIRNLDSTLEFVRGFKNLLDDKDLCKSIKNLEEKYFDMKESNDKLLIDEAKHQVITTINEIAKNTYPELRLPKGSDNVVLNKLIKRTNKSFKAVSYKDEDFWTDQVEVEKYLKSNLELQKRLGRENAERIFVLRETDPRYNNNFYESILKKHKHSLTEMKLLTVKEEKLKDVQNEKLLAEFVIYDGNTVREGIGEGKDKPSIYHIGEETGIWEKTYEIIHSYSEEYKEDNIK